MTAAVNIKVSDKTIATVQQIGELHICWADPYAACELLAGDTWAC